MYKKIINFILILCFFTSVNSGLFAFNKKYRETCLAPATFFNQPLKAKKLLKDLKRIKRKNRKKDYRLDVYKNASFYEERSIRRKYLMTCIDWAGNDIVKLYNRQFLSVFLEDFSFTFPLLSKEGKLKKISSFYLKFLSNTVTLVKFLKIPLRSLLRTFGNSSQVFIFAVSLFMFIVAPLAFFKVYVFFAGIVFLFFLFMDILVHYDSKKVPDFKSSDPKVDKSYGEGRRLIFAYMNRLNVKGIHTYLRVIIHEYLHNAPGMKKLYFNDILAIAYLSILGVDSTNYSESFNKYGKEKETAIKLANQNISVKDGVIKLYKQFFTSSMKLEVYRLGLDQEPYEFGNAVGWFLSEKYRLMKSRKGRDFAEEFIRNAFLETFSILQKEVLVDDIVPLSYQEKLKQSS